MGGGSNAKEDLTPMLIMVFMYVLSLEVFVKLNFENLPLRNLYYVHVLYDLAFEILSINRVINVVQNIAANYIFKVNNRNTRARCEICSKLTIKTPEPRQWRGSSVLIVTYFTPCSSIVIVNFEQVNVGWKRPLFLQRRGLLCLDPFYLTVKITPLFPPPSAGGEETDFRKNAAGGNE